MKRRFYVTGVKGRTAKHYVEKYIGQVLSYEYVVELATNIYCDLIADYDVEIGVGAWFEDAVGKIIFDAAGADICYISLVAVANDSVSSDRFEKDIWRMIDEEVDG